MTIKELESIKEKPLEIPSFSVHTQSVERVVQEVSKASSEVYGHTRRDGYVRARVDHREILPVFNSKKDIMKLIEY